MNVALPMCWFSRALGSKEVYTRNTSQILSWNSSGFWSTSAVLDIFVTFLAPAFTPCSMVSQYLLRDSLPFGTLKSQFGLSSGAVTKAHAVESSALSDAFPLSHLHASDGIQHGSSELKRVTRS